MERYSVQKVVGEGSFGRALLVQCKSTQEKYVVKEIQLPKVSMQTQTVMYCSRTGFLILKAFLVKKINKQ